VATPRIVAIGGGPLDEPRTNGLIRFVLALTGKPRPRTLFLPTAQELIEGGVLPSGFAADEDAAIVFEGTTLAEAVATRPEAAAYRIDRDPATGRAREERLMPRYLGAD
jgi:hypothetical protein